jgi:hypothetical protein
MLSGDADHPGGQVVMPSERRTVRRRQRLAPVLCEAMAHGASVCGAICPAYPSCSCVVLECRFAGARGPARLSSVIDVGDA